jgi:hypothetical protein
MIAIPQEKKIRRPNRQADLQRAAVYKAEATVDGGAVFRSLAAAQEWVDRLTSSRWWKSRFPSISKIILLDGRGRTNGIAARVPDQPSIGYLRLPRATRYELYVLP